MALFANGMMICLNLKNNENMKQKYVFWSKQEKRKSRRLDFGSGRIYQNYGTFAVYSKLFQHIDHQKKFLPK